jgi:hypothetical protein
MTDELLHVAHEVQHVDRAGAKLLGDLVLERLGILGETRLVDVLGEAEMPHILGRRSNAGERCSDNERRHADNDPATVHGVPPWYSAQPRRLDCPGL